MDKPLRILIHNDEPDDLVARLADQVDSAEIAWCDSYDGLADTLASFRPDVVYSVRFGNGAYPAAALKGADGPQWLSVGGSGTDHLGGWDPKVLTVTNSAGVAADMMAEYTFGAFLHFALDIAGMQADQKKQVWPPRLVTPLAGKNLLIIGLGQTGQSVARRAQAFGMNVAGIRARPQPTEAVDRVSGLADLDAELGQADFICVCVPLLDSTRGLLNADRLQKIKPGAVLVDVSRGGVVDGAGIRDALISGRLRGAALDVFETEPLPKEHPLWDTPNLIISPHCSSVYDGWTLHSIDMFAANVKRWQAGEALHNLVDPARGY